MSILAGVAAPVVRPIAAQQAGEAIVESLDAQIPVAPTIARIGGRDVLVYELHLTNARTDTLRLHRIRVYDAGDNAQLLADVGDTTLARYIQALQRGPSREPTTSLAPSVRRVFHAWFTLPSGGGPIRAVRHVIDFAVSESSASAALTLATPSVRVSERPAVVIAPPLRGGSWLALYDPLLPGGHRMSLYTLDGTARIPARFAIDFVKLPDTRRFDRTARGLKRNGYGEDILAVADGTVAATLDGRPDSDDSAPRVRLPITQASGNHVVLSLGKGRFAFYEHLAPGSIRVRVGQRVRTGEVLARLGASGSTSIGPHLHFHVADTNAVLGAEGIPFSIRSFLELGAFSDINAAVSGSPWTPTPNRFGRTGVSRRGELPVPNSVVTFP